jgi:hypothetical protein
MKLPNGARAYINIIKLREYSLNPTHPEGKHKPRVFKAALGIGPESAELLRDQLLRAAREVNSERSKLDEHGQRYVLDFIATFEGKSAHLRSAWNVRPDEDFPRLITCYVLDE